MKCVTAQVSTALPPNQPSSNLSYGSSYMQVAVVYHHIGVGKRLCSQFALPERAPNMAMWEETPPQHSRSQLQTLTITIVVGFRTHKCSQDGRLKQVVT